MYLIAYTQILRSIRLWIAKTSLAVESIFLKFFTKDRLLGYEESQWKGNGAVSVLIELPHDLFCNIVEEWIDQQLFITFVVLDAAAQDNKSLKATLSCHFEFMRSSEKILNFSYESMRGYYCDDKLFDLQRYSTRFTKELSFDVFGLMTHKEINCVAFANCCSNLQVLYWYGANLTQVSASTLKSLTHLRVDCEDHELSVILSSCRKLEELEVQDPPAPPLTHPFSYFIPPLPPLTNLRSITLIKIVKMNPNLKRLDVFGSLELLHQAFYYCPNIESIILRTPDKILSSILLIARYFEIPHSRLKHCKLERSNIDSSWQAFEVTRSESIVIGNSSNQYTDAEVMQFISAMKDISRWEFRGIIVDSTINQLVQVCASNITHFNSEFSIKLTLSSLSFMFKRCTNLREFTLKAFRLSSTDIVKLFECAPNSLQRIHINSLFTTTTLTVSVVIVILQTCQHFEYCQFDYVIDDALTDPIVVTLLIETLLAYPTRLNCKIMFGILTDKYIIFSDSKFTSHSVPHYGLPAVE